MLSLLEPLIKQVLMEGFNQQRRQHGRALGTGIGFALLSSVLACAGVVFLLFGFYSKMLDFYTVPEAALATALLTFVLSIMAAVGGWACATQRRRRELSMPPPPDISETIQTAISVFTRELEDPVRENPGTALLLAGIAGFMATRHLH